MFIIAVIIAIIIGYIFKGSIKNLEYVELKGIYIVITPFVLEASMNLMIRMGFLKQGGLTYILDIVIYTLLLYFVYLNKKNPLILLMGVGFLLNAIAIFSNGGAMPVNREAVLSLGMKGSITSVGLYKFIDAGTNFRLLADIIPSKLLLKLVFSIGDILIALGLMLFTILGMKKREATH